MNCTEEDCLSLEKELRQQRKPQVKVSFIDGATSQVQLKEATHGRKSANLR